MTMNTQERIIKYVTDKWQVPYGEIVRYFDDLAESTITRNLAQLVKTQAIQKTKSGKNTFYQLIGTAYLRSYFDTPFFERPVVLYDFDLLEGYIPNTTSFLWEHKHTLDRLINDSQHTPLSTYDYQHNIRSIENLLIDLSYSSSQLEWNTYSYLDTEILIKNNTSAEWKTQLETQMILNHKNAINYLINHRQDITLSQQDFKDIHSLLGKWLLPDSQLGVVRSGGVTIGWSSYQPLDTPDQLQSQFDLFVQKLSQIHNPFEQAMFILVFIPYFQLFEDINKRTSRIACNIPLIQRWLPPFSFLQVSDRDYIDAILAVYELHLTSPLAQLFAQHYIQNIDRYL